MAVQLLFHSLVDVPVEQVPQFTALGQAVGYEFFGVFDAPNMIV
jgi:hypothetical protein